MPFTTILGHDSVLDQFRTALAQGRLAHTYFFAGPEGVGKRLFAVTLAQAFLCEGRRNDDGEKETLVDPCGQCPACKQVLAHTHPDFFYVQKPEDKHEMPVELLIGSRENRGREGLLHALSHKPARGGRKIAIIDDADFLNEESANCLLKTLEEPPPHSLLILIGTNPELQLPTIRSRCSLIRFSALSEPTVRDLLLQRGLVSDPQQADLLASLSEGSMGRACQLADPDLFAFRQSLLAKLSDLVVMTHDQPAAPARDSATPAPTAPPAPKPRPAAALGIRLGQEVQAFVESAGSESVKQRGRAQLVVGLCIQFFRETLRRACGAPPRRRWDDAHELAVADACQRIAAEPTPSVSDRLTYLIDRCLEADFHIQRRVQLVLALEALFDDLASGSGAGS